MAGIADRVDSEVRAMGAGEAEVGAGAEWERVGQVAKKIRDLISPLKSSRDVWVRVWAHQCEDIVDQLCTYVNERKKGTDANVAWWLVCQR